MPLRTRSISAHRVALVVLALGVGFFAQAALLPHAQAGTVGVCNCSWAEAQCSVHSGNIDNASACMGEDGGGLYDPFCSWNNVFRQCSRRMCPTGCTINSPDDCVVPNATVSFVEDPDRCNPVQDVCSNLCLMPVAVPANATCTAVCGSNYPSCNNGCTAWECNNGFVAQNGSCVAQTFSCTGAAPANATLCAGDDAGLTADTARTTVASCSAPDGSAPKCQYVCSTGSVLENGACALAPPANLQLSLTIPLEGRIATKGGSHGSFATTAMEVRISGGANSIVASQSFPNLTTSDAGLLLHTLPQTSVPNGTQLTVSFKTPQHLRRTVIGTVSGGTLTINLADPATYAELDANPRKGKAFLSAGDLTGTRQGERFNDNKVDPSDIATWLAAFRKAESCTDAPSTIVEDLDGNCRVGAEDLSLIIRNMNDDGDPLPA